MTLVRAIWSIVVVCLLAGTGVQPLRAARSDRHEDRVQIGDRHPALAAVMTTRDTAVRVASRPRPVFVLAAPPIAPRLTTRAIAGSVRHGRMREATLAPLRSARGPPAR